MVRAFADIAPVSGAKVKPFDEIESQKPVGFREQVGLEFGMKTAPVALEKAPLAGGLVSVFNKANYQEAKQRIESGQPYPLPRLGARTAVDYRMTRPPGVSAEEATAGMEFEPSTGRQLIPTTQEEDEELVRSYERRMYTPKTWRGTVGAGVSRLPTYMTEFALTGNLYNTGKSIVGAKATSGTLRKLFGWLAGSTARTVGMLPRVAETTSERQLQSEFGRRPPEGIATSMAMGWNTVLIENLSEMAGEKITKGLGWGLSKLPFGKKLVPVMRKAWMKLTGGTTGEFARRLLSKGGYSNIVGELGEERFATILHAIAKTDDFGAGKDASVGERLIAGIKQDFTLSNLSAEVAVLSLPVLGAKVISKIAGKPPERAAEVITPTEPVVTAPKAEMEELKAIARKSTTVEEFAGKGLYGHYFEREAERIHRLYGEADEFSMGEPEMEEIAGIAQEQAISEIKKEYGSIKKFFNLAKAVTERPALVSEEYRQIFKDAAKQVKGIRPEVETEISRARGRIAGEMRPKIKSMREKGVPTEEAIKRSIPKGAYTEYTQRFPSIREQLGNEAVEAYFATIEKNPEFRGFEFKIKHTQEAFTKLIDGSYLTLSEAGVLNRHFSKFAPEVAELAKTRVPTGDKIWQAARLIANIPYTTLTSVMDMSGLLRQGRLLAQRYPQMAPEFAIKYADAFASEESAKRIMKEIANSPNLGRAVRVGKLELTELPSFYEEATAIEETKIASPLLEKIPILGKYLIRPTTRSFTAALNWYRMGIVDRVMTGAERKGKPLTNKQLKRLCADVNDMSGRSSLPKALKRLAPFINMLFAPRFTISRIKVLGKAAYRPNVALSMASFIGTNMLIMSLAKMLWPDDVEIEPDLRAADGGKIKVGNERIDLWAGLLPFARAIMRLATGETKTSTGRYRPIDYKREILNIFRARSNPGMSLLIDAWIGTTYIGEKFGAPPRGEWGKQLTKWKIPKWVQGLSKESWNRLGPLTMQDTVDTFIEEGLPMATTATFLSGSGIGVQTYPERPHITVAKLKDVYSELHFGEKWDDVGPIHQKVLRARYKEIRDAELAVKVERMKQPPEKISLKEMVKAEKYIYKHLASKQLKSEIDKYGVSLKVSRKIGDWWLNDDRYRRYQDLTIKALNRFNIDKVTKGSNWAQATDEQKAEMINILITTAKKAARNKIKKESNR